MGRRGPSIAALLPPEHRLRERSRVPVLLTPGRAAGLAELITLLATGAGTAALATFVHFRLGIPGHQIVYSLFPMALGFALVPRRRAGTVMGTGAVAAVMVFRIGGAAIGPGSLTSLVLAGPLLDLALRLGGRGRRLYGAFVIAGVTTNLIALSVRGSAKALEMGAMAGSRPFDSWLAEAVLTYPLAGLLAGGLSAAAWFQLRAPRSGE
jgi:hypothetical protein